MAEEKEKMKLVNISMTKGEIQALLALLKTFSSIWSWDEFLEVYKAGICDSEEYLEESEYFDLKRIYIKLKGILKED